MLGPSEGVRRGSARAIPRLSWLLLACAALEIVVLVFSWRLFEKQHFYLGRLIMVLGEAAPLLLAAGILPAARHWPAARQWLYAAALALTLRGLLDAGFELWLFSVINKPVNVTPWTGLLEARGLVADALGIAGPALLGVGLLATTRAATPVSTGRGWAMIALIGLGTVAGAGGFLNAARNYSGANGSVLVRMLHFVVSAPAIPVYALLGFAVLRVMPARGRLPELVMIAGIVVVIVATGSLNWLFALVILGEPNPPGLLVEMWGSIILWATSLIVVGTLALGSGFALAGWWGPSR